MRLRVLRRLETDRAGVFYRRSSLPHADAARGCRLTQGLVACCQGKPSDERHIEIKRVVAG